MSKKKPLKINLTEEYDIAADQTLIRPKKIKLSLENRGKDFKLDYEETFQNKQPLKNQEWTIATTLSALTRIQEDLARKNKYFIFQIKAIKKGYQLMVVSDDAFAILAGVLAELLVFGIRNKEDSYNSMPIFETFLRWIKKAKIIDEEK